VELRGILAALSRRIRIDRAEFGGAFGDMGVSLPLIIGVILASGADRASVLIVFGAMQIFCGLFYGVPMPAQPLKLVAAVVIAQNMDASIMYGAGLSVGIVMLLLTLTGLIDWITRVVPKTVVRGMQLGIGIKLTYLALHDYVGAEGAQGYVLAGVAFVLILLLLRQKRIPAALAVIALGAIYAFVFGKVDTPSILAGWGLAAPKFNVPTVVHIVEGFLLLGLAQIPLSLGNSVLATRQVAEDLFPEKKITVRQIGCTYSLMNLVAPFFSGIPVCHGSSGMVGIHLFGGRTGGATLIYGSLFLGVGLFFSGAFTEIVAVFPLPILGVLLFFQGLALVVLVRDMAEDATLFAITILVGLAAFALPYGFLAALVGGTLLTYAAKAWGVKLS